MSNQHTGHHCWICTKSVSPEDLKFDEFGFPFHESCYAAKRSTKPPKTTNSGEESRE